MNDASTFANRLQQYRPCKAALIETKQVLNDLLCLIQQDDARHFDDMEKLVNPNVVKAEG